MALLTSDIAQPVYLGNLVQNEAFAIDGEIQGTAFSIGGPFFMTAGHVVRTIQSSGKRAGIGLVEPKEHDFRIALVEESEELACDIGVLQVRFLVEESFEWRRTLNWTAEELGTFQEIKSVGYPYGFHRSAGQSLTIARGFSGHVVSLLPNFTPMGSTIKPFAAFELSFGAPLGLSGAPVLTDLPKAKICGVVIGNSQSKMLVLSREEIDEALGSKVKTEQYESLTLGVAVQAQPIFGLHSRLLNSTVATFLQHDKRIMGDA